MEVIITDDMDLEKIAGCGQAFRIRSFSDGTYRFIKGSDILYIKNTSKNSYEISCSETEWNIIWKPYLDLDRSYSSIRSKSAGYLDYIDDAMEYGTGIRILKQDPFETLITFIISQRKSIPAIASSVEKICMSFGERIDTDRETVYTFPDPDVLSSASESELNKCGLGYRTPYVLDAAKKCAEKTIDLNALYDLNDDALFNELLSIHGVGKKVANCVCLFAYARLNMVPVDVWIKRAIEEKCNGVSPFEAFGKNAGIIQQYVFFYQRNNKL